MATNTYQPWQVYTNETLMILKNKLQLLGNVNRDNEYLFAKKGMKAGTTVNLSYPARFLGRSGETYAGEAYTETSYPLVIRPLQGVDVDIPSTEWTLSLDNVKKKVLAPAAAQLANNIERDCLQIGYQAIGNSVGTPGTPPTDIKVYNQARALLVNEGFGDDADENCLLITPDMQVAAASQLATVFNPQQTVDTAFKKGLIGQGYGFKWYESANLWTHISGTRVATGGTLNGVPASGATTINITGLTPTTGTLKKGCTFTIVINAVNPMTRSSYGKTRHFTIAADTTLAGGAANNVPISPAIVYGTAFANVDAAPGTNAPITFDAAASTQSPQGLAFSPQAFTWACINQEQPGNADTYFATDPDTGIQLRFARQWEGRSNNFINRFDVLYAFGVPYPTGAVRVHS